MKTHLGCFLIVAALSFESGPLSGAEHRVEPLNEAPPTDAVAPAIAELLNSTGFKVLRGESRTAMQELARRALRARTAEEVRAL